MTTNEMKRQTLSSFAWATAAVFVFFSPLAAQSESPQPDGEQQRPVPQSGGSTVREPGEEPERETDSEEGDSLVEVIRETEGLERFSEILEQSGYADRFEEELSELHHSESTVVAPHNDAFDELSDEVIEKMKDPRHSLEVAGIVDAHLFPQGRSVEDMKNAPALFNYRAKKVSASEAEDAELALSTEDAEVRILEADIEASDGYVHIADDFLVASIDASTFESSGTVPELPGDEGDGPSPDRPRDEGDGGNAW